MTNHATSKNIDPMNAAAVNKDANTCLVDTCGASKSMAVSGDTESSQTNSTPSGNYNNTVHITIHTTQYRKTLQN